jgi:hypothetical protein
MYIDVDRELTFELKKVQSYILHGGTELFNLLKKIIEILLNSLIFFVKNFSEYSIRNIRENGLKQILYNRALRFFKLEEPVSESRGGNPIKKSKKIKFKHLLRVLIRFVLGPIYYIIVFALWIKRKNQQKIKSNHYET